MSSVQVLLALGIAGAPFAALILLRRDAPEVLVRVLVVLLPLGDLAVVKAGGFALSPSKVVYLLAWLMLAASVTLGRPMHGSRRYARWPTEARALIIGSAVIGLAPVLRADVAFHQPSYLFSFAGNVSLALLFALLWTASDVRSRANVVTVCGALVVLIGIATNGRSTVTIAASSTTSRATGTFGNPNDWAGLLVMVAGICWAYSRSDLLTTGRRAALRFLAAVLALLVLPTFSRGGLVGIAAIMIGALFMRRGLSLVSPRVWLSTVTVAVVALAAPLVVARLNTSATVRTLQQRFQEVLSPQAESQVHATSVVSRTASLHAAVHAFEHNPFLGAGPNRYAAATAAYTSYDIVAHNVMAVLAVEEGLAGILGFALIATATLSLIRRGSAHEISTRLAVALFGLLIFGQTSNILLRQHFWMLLGMLAAEVVASRRPSSQSELAEAR